MFPCFDITKKGDIFEVLVYLAQEVQVCPDPENHAVAPHDEVDSLIGTFLKKNWRDFQINILGQILERYSRKILKTISKIFWRNFQTK